MAQNEVRYKFTAEDSQFKKVAGNVGSELKKMAKDGTLGVAALSTAFYALGRSMQDTLNTMDQISKMSSKTGFSTESLSALKYAADLSGVSLESLEKSFIKLSKSVDANSTSFSKINVDLKSTNGTLKSNETILMDVADAFAGMEDGAQKTAIATDIFGKSGADMIPLLNGGSEAIRNQMQEAKNLGITFDEISAKQAERFNDAITKLEYTAKGFVTELVTALMPAIDDLSGKMENASGKSNTLKDRLSPLQAIARGIAMGFYLVAKAISIVVDALVLLWSPLEDITRALIDFGEIFWAILSGDAKKARDLSVIFNAKPLFTGTTEAFRALKANLGGFVNEVMNTALGTQHWGGSNLPTTAKTITDDEFWANRANDPKYAKEYAEYLKRKKDGEPGGNNVPKSSSAKNSEIDELKTFEQDKKDALEVIELAWSDWQIENEKATLDEKLRAEREYLQRRLTYLLQYKGSDAFGNLSVSEQNSTNNEIIKLNTELQQLNVNLKNLEKDPAKILGLGKVGDKTDFDKMFGFPDKALNQSKFQEISDKAKAFNASARNVVDENPSYETTIFDSLTNQQKDVTGKYKSTSKDLDTGYAKVTSEIDGEIKRLLDKGVSPDNIAVKNYDKLKLESYKNYIDAKTRLDKNYKDASEDIDRQTAEVKIGILSDTLSTISGLFAEHTAAYKAIMLAQIVIDTYAAATKALLLGFPFGTLQAGAIIAMGLANANKLMSTPIPQGTKFAKGGLVTSPTLGLLGEAGAEFIAPQKDFVSYTKQIIRSVENNKTSGNSFIGRLKLSGNDLIVAVERNQQLQARLGN